MTIRRSRVIGSLVVAFAVACWAETADAQRFQTLPSQPLSAGGGTAVIEDCNLLTDGTVVCHESNTNVWHRLRPNINGSYFNGTWDTIAAMPDGVDTNLQSMDVTVVPPVITGVICNPCTFTPRFFASAVLADGRMIVIGGEFMSTNTTAQVTLGGSTQVETNIGFVYDPETNTWGPQLNSAFATGTIGDAQGIVLADKRFIVANINNSNVEAFDPATNSLVALNPTGKVDRNNEEGWNLLPDNTVLTVDAFFASTFESSTRPPRRRRGAPPPEPRPTCSSTAARRSSSTSPTSPASPPDRSFEVGPGVLRPDGKLVYFSGNETGQNGVYDSATGLWSHTDDMDFPTDPTTGAQLSVPDGPAVLLPNGDILVLASPMGPVNCNADGTPPMGFPVCGTFNTPSTMFLFKYDLATGSTLVGWTMPISPPTDPASSRSKGASWFCQPASRCSRPRTWRPRNLLERRDAAGHVAAGHHQRPDLRESGQQQQPD